MPLKTLPCNVTLVVKRASAKVPLDILLALVKNAASLPCKVAASTFVMLLPSPCSDAAIKPPEILTLPLSCTPGEVAWSDKHGPFGQLATPELPCGPCGPWAPCAPSVPGLPFS